MNKTTTAADQLAARARRLLAADAYLPGRVHFAAILAERLYHLVVDGNTAGANGRVTLLDLARRLYTTAGLDARSEGCRMLGASLMGTWIDGGSRDVERLAA